MEYTQLHFIDYGRSKPDGDSPTFNRCTTPSQLPRLRPLGAVMEYARLPIGYGRQESDGDFSAFQPMHNSYSATPATAEEPQHGTCSDTYRLRPVGAIWIFSIPLISTFSMEPRGTAFNERYQNKKFRPNPGRAWTLEYRTPEPLRPLLLADFFFFSERERTRARATQLVYAHRNTQPISPILHGERPKQPSHTGTLLFTAPTPGLESGESFV